MIERITFLTLGQTPRVDLVPEIVEGLPAAVDVVEVGALDGLTRAEIDALNPASDDHALVTRLDDGSSVVIGKRWLTGRLQTLLDEADDAAESVRVLLCTGDFTALRARGLFLDGQRVMDHGIEAVGHGLSRIGVVLPIDRQVDEHHVRGSNGQQVQTAVASPYRDDDFTDVGRSLAECELIVMHCMGFTSSQRAAVAAASGRPVLLPRRLLSAALGQLL